MVTVRKSFDDRNGHWLWMVWQGAPTLHAGGVPVAAFRTKQEADAYAEAHARTHAPTHWTPGFTGEPPRCGAAGTKSTPLLRGVTCARCRTLAEQAGAREGGSLPTLERP